MGEKFKPSIAEDEGIKNEELKYRELALKKTQEKGLKIGQRVFHPDDEEHVYLIYELREDGIAVVGLPNQPRKKFPAKELIDPNIGI